MKKILLLLTSLVLILVTGCTSSQGSKSLKDIYFQIATKIENKEDIDIEYCKNQLKGYTYEESDKTTSEETNSEYKMYTYTNGNEILILSDVKYEDENAVELYYEKNKNTNGIALGYTSYSECLDDGEGALLSVSVDSSDLYTNVYEIINEEETDLEEIYTQVATSMDTDKGITISKVKKLANEDPDSKNITDSDTSKEVTCYYYNTDEELLEIYTLKGENKVSKISYDRSDKLLIKDTMNKELLNNSTTSYASSITTYVKDVATQKKVFKIIE